MKTLIVGMGEVGQGLYTMLCEHYTTSTVDVKSKSGVGGVVDIMHVCIPYSSNFSNIVLDYVSEHKPQHVVIHSTVPIGTTKSIGSNIEAKVYHSPIRGKHPAMVQGLKVYVKYLSFDFTDIYGAQDVAAYFEKAGFKVKILADTKTTELGKLLSLSRYGVNLAFAKEQEQICEHFGVDFYKVVVDFEATRNEGLEACNTPELGQPILHPFKDYVGGHCVVENMELLLKQKETPLLKQSHYIDKATVIWENCNIYPTAIIGKGCSIGQLTEIGPNVVIGNNVRIGAHCFIPEGVTIEDDAFIAPKVAFSNDKHPPSYKKKWGKTLVKKRAVIGMGSIILPGLTIGRGALIGAGSVVTKSVPANEVWYGQAACAHTKRERDSE